MTQIIPGILEKDWQQIERKLEIIKPFSRFVHIDFLDGKFSPETSFMDIEQFKKYKDDFFMEAHLMVEDPAKYVKPLSEAGFNRFLGHIEKMKDLDEFVAEGQIHGEVGIAVDIDTEVESLKVLYDDLDCVLFMSIKAGKSGQVFLPQVLEKIKKLKQATEIPVAIDGGINEQTILDAKEAGAKRFVATSYIFQNHDPMQAYEKLVNLASG
jgi:ribulose-phosphate 3-epimerase